jgi:DNA invertase Pin-like site-specific DNA recombinase
MKVYGYTRVSGQAQVTGDGHPRQIETIRSFREQHASLYPAIRRIYSDDAVPGKVDADERPQFQAMLAECTGGDVVIVEALDRLARSYATQEKLLSLLVSKGITLISANTGENVTEAFMGDPMRRALVQIQGIFAELDKNLIISKLSKARERIKKEGRREGAKLYSPDPVLNKRVEGRKPYGHRPGEQQILNLMLDMYIQGKTVTEIAGVLNRAGRKPRTGERWHPATVGKILRRVNVGGSSSTALGSSSASIVVSP